MNFEELTKKINDMNTIELQTLIQKIKYAFKLEEATEENNTENSKLYNDLIKEICDAKVKEIVDFISHLETVYDVKAGCGVGAGGESDGEGQEKAAEKSSYAVVISNLKPTAATQKVQFIQALRAQAPTIGLQQGMSIFNSLSGGESFTVFESLGKDECATFQKALESYVEVTLK